MSTSDKKFAAVYQYDPLDRLIAANTAQRFYNNTRIATEIEGTVKRSFFEHDAQPLAQQQAGTTTLLAIDQQASVLHSVSTTQSAPHTYTPYGHRPVENGLLSVLGFNGERPDPLSGYYLLGQGYRAFNPALMRFNSPDSFSPFGEGGINAYAYCAGDPINSSDPTGHWDWPKFISYFFKSGTSVNTPNSNALTSFERSTLFARKFSFNDEIPGIETHRTGAVPSTTAPNGPRLAAGEAASKLTDYNKLIAIANGKLTKLDHVEEILKKKLNSIDDAIYKSGYRMKDSPDNKLRMLKKRDDLYIENSKLQTQRKFINREIDRHTREINIIKDSDMIRKKNQ